MYEDLTELQDGTTKRVSSWDETGRNLDRWIIEPGEKRVLADIKGPGRITHIWMTQQSGYRECVLQITWDNAEKPSVRVPLGDFFGLGHNIVNSYESFLFNASAKNDNTFNEGCALNCYVQMPFRERALIELINEGEERHGQYFYIDYEEGAVSDKSLYFHAEFRRQNPFGGWGGEIHKSLPETKVVNKERQAWEDNYVILETEGKGHFIGCNISVTNMCGSWWGEGDDMIWVDGYKWPPDIHGTGSEDYLGHAWGMQRNAFLRNGTSIHEWDTGGYQTSYVHHLENPVRFNESIKVTIEHGHGNHLRNEMSSVAYWYAVEPAAAVEIPPVEQRMPVPKNEEGRFSNEESGMTPVREVSMNAEIKAMKEMHQERRALKEQHKEEEKNLTVRIQQKQNEFDE
jgi:hypothetical protein